MTTNAYDIGATFSSGLSPRKLLLEVVDEAVSLGFTRENAIAFFSKTSFSNVSQNASGVIISGTMTIETPRDFTAGESNALDSVFASHTPGPSYQTHEDLGAGNFPGEIVYIGNRNSEAGTPGVLYWWNPQSSTWHRTSSNGVVKTIV